MITFFFFFFEKTIRGESSPDFCFLLVICPFFLTLSTGKQQGHMLKFLSGKRQPLRGTQVKPCCAPVGSSGNTTHLRCASRKGYHGHLFGKCCILHSPFLGLTIPVAVSKVLRNPAKKTRFTFFPKMISLVDTLLPIKKLASLLTSLCFLFCFGFLVVYPLTAMERWFLEPL